MKHFELLSQSLHKQQKLHNKDIINYTIPQSWNTYGFHQGINLMNNEMILQPYDFYAFAIEKQLAYFHEVDTKPKKHKEWLKKSFVHFLDIRTFGSWDHDRSGTIDDFNMYGLADTGTFLKAIVLLPLLKRTGVNAIVLHNYRAVDKKSDAHDFADPHATTSFRDISSDLYDPMLSDMSLIDQMHAFIEACHLYEINIMLDFCPACMSRNSVYIKEHPEWFYWVKTSALANYHAPQVDILPTGCVPTENICRVLYDSEDVQEHISSFVVHPKAQDEVRFLELMKSTNDTETLARIESQFQCSVAPMISDQINSTLPPFVYSLLRFYDDLPAHHPKHHKAPYLLTDSMRTDIFPGKKIMKSLWEEIQASLVYWLEEFEVDGFYISKPYLLPEKLIKEMNSTIQKLKLNTALVIESTNAQDISKWKKRGFDAMSGASGYTIHDVYNFQYHNFTYALLNNPLPLFAASECIDTPRITSMKGNDTLSNLLTFMNLFLPNAIPCLMSGQLCLERQPQYLSPFNNQEYLNILDKKDPQYRKQALLDRFSYDYTRKDFHVLINHLEKFSSIRKQFIDAIVDVTSCIPVWFDTPKDSGIGFTFIKENKALLVVCNCNVFEEVNLHIHTENMLWELPFACTTIRQIYSSSDPFIHELTLDSFQNIPLSFAPGEVKCIELYSEEVES